MKATELRIGNLVTIDNPEFWKGIKGNVLEVNGINIASSLDFPKSTHSISVRDEKFTYSQFNEFIKPIPLTEEWMLKFGFEKDGDYFSLGNFHYHLPSCLFYSGNDHVSGGNADAIIKYVHQLQNLYFALTGEELQIIPIK